MWLATGLELPVDCLSVFVCPTCFSVTNDEGLPQNYWCKCKKPVPRRDLPRQDQLQEMVSKCVDHNGEYGKGAYLLRVFVEWMPTSKGNESGSSLEQLLLAFVMHEKYQKQWDEERRKWIKENN